MCMEIYYYISISTCVCHHVSARREVKTRPHVVWLDNFSKTRVRQVPDLAHGSWADCLWTGRALRAYPRDDVSLDCVHDATGSVIPIMPNDLFERSDELLEIFERCCVNKPMERHGSSLAHLYDVRSIPLKPNPQKVEKKSHRDALTDDHDRLNTLIPESIQAINIGSNLGLATILRRHFEEQNQHVRGMCEKYTCFMVDCNIFDRILKVITCNKHTGKTWTMRTERKGMWEQSTQFIVAHIPEI